MSICRGVAGLRGGNPRGIFIHNDAGSQNANAAFYKKWLQTHPLENGFAHAYVASDGILYAEDDAYAAWHCGQTDGNRNYYSIDAVEVYYDTPADIVAKYGYQKAQYRVAPIGGGYYPWQFDNETGNGQDGYAGCFGIAFDKFQLY